MRPATAIALVSAGVVLWALDRAGWHWPLDAFVGWLNADARDEAERMEGPWA